MDNIKSCISFPLELRLNQIRLVNSFLSYNRSSHSFAEPPKKLLVVFINQILNNHSSTT